MQCWDGLRYARPVSLATCSPLFSEARCLSMPPFSSPRSSQTGRSRNGTPRSPTAMLASSISTSGALGSGWTWSSMTGCPQSTTNSFTATPTRKMSSGVPWWRRPMPSRCGYGQAGWPGGLTRCNCLSRMPRLSGQASWAADGPRGPLGKAPMTRGEGLVPSTQQSQSLGPRTLPTRSVIGEVETWEKAGALPQLGRLTLMYGSGSHPRTHTAELPGSLSCDVAPDIWSAWCSMGQMPVFLL